MSFLRLLVHNVQVFHLKNISQNSAVTKFGERSVDNGGQTIPRVESSHSSSSERTVASPIIRTTLHRNNFHTVLNNRIMTKVYPVTCTRVKFMFFGLYEDVV